MPMPGKYGGSTALMPRLPAVSVMPAAEVDALAVDGDHADDLAEGERHDRDVVAAQAQRRQADDHAGDRADRRRADQDQQEVEVDADLAWRRRRATPTWMCALKKKPEPNQPIA